MKTISTLFLLLLCLTSIADNSEIQRLLNEREEQSVIYHSLIDSVIPGRLSKMYMLNNQLQNIVSKDDSIILHTYSLLDNEASAVDSINKVNQRLALLAFDNDRLQQRTTNDMKMLLILKLAVALLLVSFLILLYFATIKLNRKKSSTEVQFGLLSGLESENANLRTELERIKSREFNLKDELDRGIQLHQDKYALLTEKFNQLLAENQKLKQMPIQQSIPEDKEASELIDLLKIENNNLTIKLNGMQQQLDESHAKNQSILKKIEKLINDLSGVG